MCNLFNVYVLFFFVLFRFVYIFLFTSTYLYKMCLMCFFYRHLVCWVGVFFFCHSLIFSHLLKCRHCVLCLFLCPYLIVTHIVVLSFFVFLYTSKFNRFLDFNTFLGRFASLCARSKSLCSLLRSASEEGDEESVFVGVVLPSTGSEFMEGGGAID